MVDKRPGRISYELGEGRTEYVGTFDYDKIKEAKERHTRIRKSVGL